MHSYSRQKRKESHFGVVFDLLISARAGEKCRPGQRRSVGPGRAIFSKDHELFIREHYKLMSLPVLFVDFVERFGEVATKSQLRAYISRKGILSGRSGKFEPGSLPWNTGTKGVCRPNSGSFKRGDMPANTRGLWSERINKDGFVEIKVPEKNPYTGCETRFKHKHVYVWERVNGPVPVGHAISFVDGDKVNCAIENLMLVTRSELLSMNLHGYKDTPAELKPAVLGIAKIEARAGFRLCPGNRGRSRRRCDASK